MDKSLDITNRYSKELSKIANILQNIEDGRFYEKSGAMADGSISTNIAKLRRRIDDLICKIEYNMDSEEEELRKAFEIYNYF